MAHLGGSGRKSKPVPRPPNTGSPKPAVTAAICVAEGQAHARGSHHQGLDPSPVPCPVPCLEQSCPCVPSPRPSSPLSPTRSQQARLSSRGLTHHCRPVQGLCSGGPGSAMRPGKLSSQDRPPARGGGWAKPGYCQGPGRGHGPSQPPGPLAADPSVCWGPSAPHRSTPRGAGMAPAGQLLSGPVRTVTWLVPTSDLPSRPWRRQMSALGHARVSAALRPVLQPLRVQCPQDAHAVPAVRGSGQGLPGRGHGLCHCGNAGPVS